MKTIKLIANSIFIGVFVLTIGVGVMKLVVESQANKKLNAFMKEAEAHQTPSAYMLNATLHVFNQFHEGGDSASASPLAALQPVLTSHLLPGIIRTSPGAFDVVYPQYGDEKSAARMLKYVLAQRDIDSILWRILSPSGLKTSIAADLKDGAYRYLDPMAGVVAMYQNKVLIGPYAAREIMMDNVDHREIFVKLTEEADASFYKDFAHTMMAPPGYKLHVNVAAPVFEEPLVLGSVDGQSEDVASAASEISLTPFFDYIGQKYEGGIERTVYFTEAAKVTFVLTGEYDPSVMTANIQPTAEGQKLVFEVPEDEALIFDDSKVDASLLNKHHHIPVDQIIIEQL